MRLYSIAVQYLRLVCRQCFHRLCSFLSRRTGQSTIHGRFHHIVLHGVGFRYGAAHASSDVLARLADTANNVVSSNGSSNGSSNASGRCLGAAFEHLCCDCGRYLAFDCALDAGRSLSRAFHQRIANGRFLYATGRIRSNWAVGRRTFSGEKAVFAEVFQTGPTAFNHASQCMERGPHTEQVRQRVAAQLNVCGADGIENVIQLLDNFEETICDECPHKEIGGIARCIIQRAKQARRNPDAPDVQ